MLLSILLNCFMPPGHISKALPDDGSLIILLWRLCLALDNVAPGRKDHQIVYSAWFID